MLFCTLTNCADGRELWSGSLLDFCTDNAECYETTARHLRNGPIHVSGGASDLTLLRISRPHLTRDDTAITEIDAAILVRLADRMARTRAAWFEPADGTRQSIGADFARRNLSQSLLTRYFAQREGYAGAHTSDVQLIANLDRLIKSDWLPSAAVEFLGE